MSGKQPLTRSLNSTGDAQTLGKQWWEETDITGHIFLPVKCDRNPLTDLKFKLKLKFLYSKKWRLDFCFQIHLVILLFSQFGSRTEGPAYWSHWEAPRWQDHGGSLEPLSLTSLFRLRMQLQVNKLKEPCMLISREDIGSVNVCCLEVEQKCTIKISVHIYIIKALTSNVLLTNPLVSLKMGHSWWPAASSWRSRRFVRSALTWSTRTTGSCVTCWLTWRSGGRWSSSTCWPVTPGHSFLTRTSMWVSSLHYSENSLVIPTHLHTMWIWGELPAQLKYLRCTFCELIIFLLFCYCLCSKLKPSYQYFLL